MLQAAALLRRLPALAEQLAIECPHDYARAVVEAGWHAAAWRQAEQHGQDNAARAIQLAVRAFWARRRAAVPVAVGEGISLLAPPPPRSTFAGISTGQGRVVPASLFTVATPQAAALSVGIWWAAAWSRLLRRRAVAAWSTTPCRNARWPHDLPAAAAAVSCLSQLVAAALLVCRIRGRVCQRQRTMWM